MSEGYPSQRNTQQEWHKLSSIKQGGKVNVKRYLLQRKSGNTPFSSTGKRGTAPPNEIQAEKDTLAPCNFL